MCHQSPGTDVCITFKFSLMRGRFKKRGNKERKSDCGTLKKRRGTCKLVIDALLAACTWIWRDVVGVASCRDGKIRSFHGKVPFVAW